MHSRILCALLGGAAGNVAMPSYLAKGDWETDYQGISLLWSTFAADPVAAVLVALLCGTLFQCLNSLICRSVLS